MPPKVPAGLARSRVSGYRRSPAPPASKTPSVSFIGFRFDAAFGPEEAPWSLSFRRPRTRDSVPEQLHSCRQGLALAQIHRSCGVVFTSKAGEDHECATSLR